MFVASGPDSLDLSPQMNVRRWLLPVLWAGVMVTGTSLPSSAVPGQLSAYDKLLHFTIYAIFAFLLSRQISETASRWWAALLAIGIAVLFGVVDEWHQGFIPGRSMELADWQADSLGALVGAVAGVATRRRNQVGNPTPG
jgi:VanZ family protein